MFVNVCYVLVLYQHNTISPFFLFSFSSIRDSPVKIMSRFLIAAVTLSSTIMSIGASYSQIQSGTCGSLITDKATCETAARSLGLSVYSDTAAETDTQGKVPGCSYNIFNGVTYLNLNTYENTANLERPTCGYNDIYGDEICICQESCDSTVSSSCDGCGSDGMW